MKNKEKDVLQKPIEQFNIRCEHGTKVYEDILTEWLNESSYFPLGCQKIESQSDGENDMRSGDYELDYKLFMSQSEGTFRGKLDSYKTPTEFNALLYLIETWDFEKDSVSDSQLLDKSAQRDMNNLIDITTKEKNLFFFIPYKYKNINPLEMLIILNAKLKSWLQYRNKQCPNHDTFISWVHLIEGAEDDYTWDEKGNLQKVNMQFVFAKYSTETKQLDMIDCINIQEKHIFCRYSKTQYQHQLFIMAPTKQLH